MSEPVHVILGELARETYCAYGSATGWKNYQGNDMPAWDDLGQPIQDAWIAASWHAYQRGYSEGTGAR